MALRTYVHNYYSKVVAMRARSLDIREKIIKFHLDGLSKHQIARQLQESRSTVIRIIKKYEETGTLEELLTKSLQQEWKKISVDEIRKICAAAPNRLKAIAEKEGHHVE